MMGSMVDGMVGMGRWKDGWMCSHARNMCTSTYTFCRANANYEVIVS